MTDKKEKLTFPPWFEKFSSFEAPWIPPALSSSVPIATSSWFSCSEEGSPQLTKASSSWLPSIQNKEIRGMFKVRLYPTPSQQEKLELMLSANRYSWNDLVSRTKNKVWQSLDEEKTKELRSHIQKRRLKSLKYRISSCPEECFDSAFSEFLWSIKSIKARSAEQLKKKGKGIPYPDSFHYKKKKESKGYVDIRSRTLNYNASERTISFFPRFFGKVGSKIAMKTDLLKLGISSFDFSCKLTKRDGFFYLLVPHTQERKLPKVPSEICALDPGVRTFLTGYNPEGTTFEISTDQSSLYNRRDKISNLQKWLSVTKSSKSRTKLKRRIRSLYRKSRNCVDDLHAKSAKLLANSFSEILLPSFATSEMAEKENRTIGPATTYVLLTLAHYRFRRVLQHQMNLRNNKLEICEEEYTSMTCGRCGKLNRHLGGSKEFVCPERNCGLVLDRDINAARNIFIKNREH